MDIPRIEGFDITVWVRDNSAGSLWRARQRSLDRPVLLLVVDDRGDPARRDALLGSARLAARINQSGLVGVHDVVDTPNGPAFVVLEDFDGESLLDKLTTHGPFPEERLVAVAHGVADILSRAWSSHRYVHRNLKPEEIFLQPDGAIRIAGFASGTIVGDDGLLADRSGDVVGTPTYMAPEQAQARPTLDFRADMYALGAILCHLATGQRPFGELASDPMRLLASLNTAELDSPRFLRPELGTGLEAVLARLLMKEPQDRYNSWGGLLQDLDSLAVGQAPTIAPAFVPLGRSTLRQAPSFPPAASDSGATAPDSETEPTDDSEGVLERVQRLERATSARRTPSALWFVLAVALIALAFWRWNNPDIRPTVASLAARWAAFRAQRAASDDTAQQGDAAIPEPVDATPFLPPPPDKAPPPAPRPSVPSDTEWSHDTEGFDETDDMGDFQGGSGSFPATPQPSRAPARPASPPPPAATPQPPRTPEVVPPAPTDALAQAVFSAVRHSSGPALRDALRAWSAEHHDEAVAAAEALRDCGWPDDRLGIRLCRHGTPVRIPRDGATVAFLPERYLNGTVSGRIDPGRNGEGRPASFAIADLDRSLRWSLYRESAPAGVSTEPESHAATALYALAAGDLTAFREAFPLAGGLEPVLRRVDTMIRKGRGQP